MLLGKITEVFGTQTNFAKAIGLSERSVSLKLNGKVPWTQPEITKACKLLGIPDKKINLYFFIVKVQ
jgi:hypothetical protein